MTLYQNYEKAINTMKMRNRADKHNLTVIVEGPENDYFLMTVEEAIDNDLFYTWEV